MTGDGATRLVIDMITKYGFWPGHMVTLTDAYIRKEGLPEEYLEKANSILNEEMVVCENLIREGKERILRLVDVALEKTACLRRKLRKF